MLRNLTYIFLILCLCVSCKPSNEDAQHVDWGDYSEFYLKGKEVSIKLPGEFIESSRYRIKDDLPSLNNKSAAASVIEDALTKFERKDAVIDVFVDTTSQYRFVTILDSDEKIAIDKSSAARLGRLLMEDYEKMDLSKRGIDVQRIESNIKKNSHQKMAKFKFEIRDKRKKSKTFATSFFITNSTRTLIIHEFSDTKDDIEFYTWSISENF